MKIHNLYSDLLRSLIFLLNNHIYGKNTIKKFIFNIGNRTFQLEYNTQFNLPNAIITLNESMPLNLHPTNIQRIGMPNINRIPVIYNRTKDLTIELQEEHYIIGINIDINCESQFHAKNLEFQLLSVMPLNKWMFQYNFTSFIEIDEDIFNKDIISLDEHDIVNIFRIYDYNQAKSIKSFAINYKPLIRLTSTSVNISSTEQRTFTLNCVLEFMIQFPQYLFIPMEQRPHDFIERVIEKKDIVIDITEDDTQLLYFEFFDSTTNQFAVIEYQPIIQNVNYNNNLIINIFKSEIISNTTYAKFEWISNRFNDVLLNASNDIIIKRNLKDNKIINIETRGFLIGKIHDIVEDFDNSFVSGVFEGTFNNKLVKDRIEFKYNNIHSLSNLHYKTFPEIPGFGTNNIRILPKTQYIYSLVPKINENRADVNIQKSILKKLIYKDLSTNQILELNINKHFDETNHIITNIFNNITLTVILDNGTKKLRHSITSLEPLNFKPLAFVFDLLFHTKPTYGGTYIERINIDFFSDDNPISTISIVDLLDNYETSPIKREDIIKHSQLIKEISFINDNQEYFILPIHIDNINLQPYTITNIKYILKNSKFKLHYTKIINPNDFMLESIDYTTNTLLFKIKKEFFYRTFTEVNNQDPLLFHLIIKES